jgi:hypothetical protein
LISRHALKPLFGAIHEQLPDRGLVPRVTDRLINHFASAVLDGARV